MTKQIKPSEWINKQFALLCAPHPHGPCGDAHTLEALIQYLDLLAEKHPEIFNLDDSE